MSQDALTPEEYERYCRQIGPGVLSPEGQLRLRRSTALVARAGGVGGPAAMSLVSAGVGRLVFAHGGTLIPADLNRQLLGSEAGLGKPRAPQFAQQLAGLNHFVRVEAVDHEPGDEEAFALAREADVVLSCAPTFEERLRWNAAAVAARVPLIDAAQWGLTGTLIVVAPGRSACLRCIYPNEPPFEEMFPVLGAISATMGSLAALEAVKILSGDGQPMFGRLWMLDAFHGRSSILQLQRDLNCPCCGAIPGAEK